MGNEAQIRKGSTAMSTSTRNFPNRLGIDTQFYLGPPSWPSICALMDKMTSVAEHAAKHELIAVGSLRWQDWRLHTGSTPIDCARG